MEEFDFDQSLKETTSFARDKVDNILYKTTDRVSKTAGEVAIVFVVLFLFSIVFIFLNITLAIMISQWFGFNYCWGFLIIALFYSILLSVFLVVSPVVKSVIYSKIASVALGKIKEVDGQIDSLFPDDFKRNVHDKAKLDIVLSKKIDRNTVNSLIDYSERKCVSGEISLKKNMVYVKTHFKTILFNISKHLAFEVLSQNKYIAKCMGFIDPMKYRINKKMDVSASPDDEKSKKGLDAVQTIFVAIAPFVKSFLWSLAISKVKKMILNKILPFKKKRK